MNIKQFFKIITERTKQWWDNCWKEFEKYEKKFGPTDLTYNDLWPF